MKNQGNMTSSKDHNNFPATDSKDMEICNLLDKEFRVAVVRKLNNLQKHEKGNSMKLENNIQTKMRS